MIIWVRGQDEPALVINAHDDGVTSTDFSPDGQTIVSASYDGTAKVWNAESGDQLIMLDNDPDYEVYDARFSDDGKQIVTASKNNKAEIWDASTGKEIVQLSGHTDYVLTAVFSHDGNYVYTGSYDNTVRKWDANTGQLLLTFAGHTGRVKDLDISADDSLLVSGSADTTVKVWDLKTNKELFTYRGNNETTNSVAFNPQGTRVLTASSDETTKEFTIDYDELLQVAQQYELRELTGEECQRFLKRDDCSLHLFGGIASNTEVTPTPATEEAPTPVESSAQSIATVTATAESQVLPEAQSFYTEGFDGNLDTWSSNMVSGIESQVNMGIDHGSLFVQLSPHEDKIPWVLLINDAFTYGDVQVEAIIQNNGNNANGTSLVCRYSDSGWYEFWISNAGLYAIYSYDAVGTVQQGYDELFSGGSSAIQPGHVSNVIKAICKGNELTLLVNDTIVKTIDDATPNFRAGEIGVGVSSPQLLPVDVQFESVTVSEP